MIKKSLLCLICIFTLLGTVDAKDSSASEKSVLGANDYTYSCWLNGWRKNANDSSADVFAIETSHYGFSLDVGDFRKLGLARLTNSASYSDSDQAPVVKAELIYTTATGKWSDRPWTVKTASLDRRQKSATATLPMGTKVYYFNFVDNRNLRVSSTLTEIP